MGFGAWSSILGQVLLDRLGGGDPVSAQFQTPNALPADQKAKVARG